MHLMKYSGKDGENGMSKSYLLDTNIVSAILRKNEKIDQKMEQVRRQGMSMFISGITYYEIKRGLPATNATRKLLDFEFFCRKYQVLPVLNEIEVLEKASEIHAELKRQGRRLEDAEGSPIAVEKLLVMISYRSPRPLASLKMFLPVHYNHAPERLRCAHTATPTRTGAATDIWARCKLRGREVIGNELTIVYSNLPIIIHFFNMEARNSRK